MGNRKIKHGLFMSYATMVKQVDDSFGHLMDTLNNTPLDKNNPKGPKLIDNTVVIFYSDNGGLFGVTT